MFNQIPMASAFFTFFLLASSLIFSFAKPQSNRPAPFYSSSFVTPKPPNITTEFRANWQQHKYDVNINDHIVSGFLYLSPSQGKIRLDAAGNGRFESSLFDFTNTTSEGLVSNVILSYAGGVTSSTCSYYYVSPFIIPFPANILQTTGAVYTGYQHDELHGQVTTWTFPYTNVIIKMFLDEDNTLVRYDFAAPGPLRTFTTTRFYDIILDNIDGALFGTSCSK